MKKSKGAMRVIVRCAVVVLAVATAGAAIALESELLFDGGSTNVWSTARDAARLTREFAVSELTQTDTPTALRWRFEPNPGTAFNDIFLTCRIARRFDALRVYVKNEGAAFELAMKARDARNSEWTAQRVPLAAAGEWQWVEFPWPEWRVAPWSKDADGVFDLPITSLALIAFNVKTGQTYALRVAAIETVSANRPTARVSDFQVPTKIKAGEPFDVAFAFTLDRPVSEEEACLVFRRGNQEVGRAPLTLPRALKQVGVGEAVRVATTVSTPLYAMGGEQAVALHLGDARICLDGSAADDAVAAVTVVPRRPGRCNARVKPHNGVPTLFINGKPHNGMAWATYHPSSAVFRDFTRAGITLYTFSATPTESGYGLARTAWTAPDTYDFSQLDERAMMLLAENPDAYFFPRLYLHAPRWWSERHPDDIVLMDPGDGRYVPFIHSGGKFAPSWASEQWRRDTIEGLRRLIKHVEASPYADRVIGYHLASGTTEEWMMWGGNERHWVDFSPVNTRRFRDWLRAKYRKDAALREAWQDPAVSFDTAVIPPRAQREHAEIGSLRDPAKEQAVIDFYLYNSDLVADTICTFARAVKGFTHRKKVVGAFYGYLLQLCGEQRQQNAGHLALAKVLVSRDIDFLTSPTSYAFRQFGGEGTSHFMSLLGSVTLSGKLWFDENDIRTSLVPGAPGTWGKAADVAGDIVQQEKELANVMVNGTAQWWFDVGSNVYGDPMLMDRIARLVRNASEIQALDRTPADEVAMIVDERSLCWMRVGDKALGAPLLVGQLPALSRIGAPVGHYLASDLPRLRDHKVFFIMTSFAPTEQDRRAIDALKRDGRVLVFVAVPGLYREGRFDESGMEALTGIRLRLDRAAAPYTVNVTGGHPWTKELAGTTYGSGVSNAPICYADDAGAQVLGTLSDGRPGLVVKAGEGWTSVFSTAPLLPARLMRAIVEGAGVHTYIETDDVVWANRQMVAVSVKEGGRRKVRLPRAGCVRDLYSGEYVAQDVAEFETDFAEHATRVFVVE